MDDTRENTPGAAKSEAARDLSFLWPVIDRVRAVELKFHDDPAAPSAGVPAGIEARLAALEAQVAGLAAHLQGAPGAAAAAPSTYPAQSFSSRAAAGLTTIFLLLVAHLLIVIVYDLRVVFLLLASILIPLTTAIAFTLRRRIAVKVEIAAALAVGIIAVAGMSYATSIVENTSFGPANAREWGETLQYVASIALAYVTGILVSRACQAIEAGSKLGTQVKTIQGLISTAVPATTAVASIVTGINGLLK